MGNEMSSLHNAAAKNNTGLVRRLIDQERMDPNMRDKDDWVPLHFAAYGGSTGACRELLSRGAKTSSVDKGGRTPLHLAALKGQLAALQQLLLAGADANARDTHMLTPLHMAALGGFDEACKALCAAGSQVNAEVEDGSNPIHLAAWKGHHDVIKALIPLGGDYKKPRKDGNTALHEAAQCGDEKLLIALMRLGADRFSRNQDGKTPAEIAKEYDHEAAERLITQGPPPKGASKDAASSVMPGSQAEKPSAPSAPSLPPEFASGGRVQYPTISNASKGTKQPDWWSDNIGREVQQAAPPARAQPQGQPQPGSREEFEQNLGRQVQGALGNLAKGFGALQQGVLGGGGGGQQDHQKQQQQQQQKARDDDWAPAARQDEWGSTQKPAAGPGANKAAAQPAAGVPRQEKYDLQPYDSDDYDSAIQKSVPKDGQSGADSPYEIQRKLAELELSVNAAQGWQRGGLKKSDAQKQQEEIRRLQAQLDSYGKRGGTGYGQGRRQSDSQHAPQEYVCPITQEVMKEPVIAADGHSYERAAIMQWLKTGHTVSPVANEPLSHPGLTSNHSLRKAIQTWQAGH